MSTKSKQDKLRSIAEYKAKKEANEIEKQKELMLQFPTLFSPEKIKKIEQRKHERLPISIKNEVKNIKQENLNKNQFKKGNNNNSNNSPNKINLLEKKKQFQLLTNPKNENKTIKPFSKGQKQEKQNESQVNNEINLLFDYEPQLFSPPSKLQSNTTSQVVRRRSSTCPCGRASMEGGKVSNGGITSHRSSSSSSSSCRLSTQKSNEFNDGDDFDEDEYCDICQALAPQVAARNQLMSALRNFIKEDSIPPKSQTPQRGQTPQRRQTPQRVQTPTKNTPNSKTLTPSRSILGSISSNTNNRSSLTPQKSPLKRRQPLQQQEFQKELQHEVLLENQENIQTPTNKQNILSYQSPQKSINKSPQKISQRITNPSPQKSPRKSYQSPQKSPQKRGYKSSQKSRRHFSLEDICLDENENINLNSNLFDSKPLEVSMIEEKKEKENIIVENISSILPESMIKLETPVDILIEENKIEKIEESEVKIETKIENQPESQQFQEQEQNQEQQEQQEEKQQELLPEPGFYDVLDDGIYSGRIIPRVSGKRVTSTHVEYCFFIQILSSENKTLLEMMALRRYSQFEQFYNQLYFQNKEIQNYLWNSKVQFPKKQLFPHWRNRWSDENFLAEREKELDCWLNYTLLPLLKDENNNHLSTKRNITNLLKDFLSNN